MYPQVTQISHTHRFNAVISRKQSFATDSFYIQHQYILYSTVFHQWDKYVFGALKRGFILGAYKVHFFQLAFIKTQKK